MRHVMPGWRRVLADAWFTLAEALDGDNEAVAVLAAPRTLAGGRLPHVLPSEVSDVFAWLAGPGSATLSGAKIAFDRGVMKY